MSLPEMAETITTSSRRSSRSWRSGVLRRPRNAWAYLGRL